MKLPTEVVFFLSVWWGISPIFASAQSKVEEQIGKGRRPGAGITTGLTEEQILKLCAQYEAQDKLPRAIGLLEKQTELFAESVRLRELLARYYIQTEQIGKAISIYQQLIGMDCHNPDYWVQFGQLFSWNDQQEKAILAYEEALRLQPDNVAVMKKLEQLYQWNDQQEKAFLLQKVILRHEPDNLELWKQHGIQARWINRYEEAVDSFKEVLAHDPRNVEAFFLLGETYLWMEKNCQAELCLREVLRLQPDHLQARFYYAQLKQWQPFGWWQAKENYRWILQRQPEHKESLHNLRLLRKEYGPLLQNDTQWIHDSNDLKKTEVSSRYQRYLSPFWRIHGELLYRRMEEQKPTGRFYSFGEGMRIGNTYFASGATRFLVFLGSIHYNRNETFPLAEVRWQQTVYNKKHWPGQLYSNSSFRLEQVLDGVLAIQNRYQARTVANNIYWEPHSSLHIGNDLEYSWYSDQNQKMQWYFSAEYRFFTGKPSLFLESIYAYQDMKIRYPDAIPYWTPINFWTRSLGLDAVLPLVKTIHIRGGYARTQQTGEEWANNWKAEWTWHPNDFSELFFRYYSFGSKFYSVSSFQLRFSYRW